MEKINISKNCKNKILIKNKITKRQKYQILLFIKVIFLRKMVGKIRAKQMKKIITIRIVEI